MNQTIPSLTGIRGIAALLVVFYHLPLRKLGAVPALIAHGDRGVDLFFILSGFILSHVHAKEFGQPSWVALRSFLIVRLFRVYPLHLVVMVLTLMFVAANPEFVTWARTLPPDGSSGEPFSIAGFFQTLVLANRIGLPSWGAWNVPSWSLSSEIAGYLAFPVLAFAMRRTRSLAACYGVAVLCLGGFCLILEIKGHIGVIGMAFCFASGMALARARELRPVRIPGLVVISAIVSIALLCSPFFSELSVFGFAGLIYGLSLGPSVVGEILSSAPAMFLGNISFSLYLTHFNVLYALSWVDDFSKFAALQMVGAVATFIAIAALSFRFIEKPSHAIGRRLGQRPPAN